MCLATGHVVYSAQREQEGEHPAGSVVDVVDVVDVVCDVVLIFCRARAISSRLQTGGRTRPIR